MPYYDYQCKKCKHEWEESLTIAKRNDPLDLPCPECKIVGNVTKLVGTKPIPELDPVQLGRIKPSGGFQNRLRDIQESHGMGMNGRFGHNITEI